MWNRFLFAVCFWGICSVLFSQTSTLLLEENFDFSAGSNLAGQNDWTQGVAGTNPVTISASGLNWRGYPGSGTGLGADFTPLSDRVQKPFSGTLSNTYYYSFLINVSSAGSGEFFAGFFSNNAFRGRVYIKAEGSGFQFGLAKTTTGTVSYTSGTPYVFGTTYLILVKYDFVAGDTNDQVSLFINPDLTTNAPTTPVIGPVTDAGNDVSANVFAIQARTNSGSFKIDGVRVASTWSAINGTDTGDNPNDGNDYVTINVKTSYTGSWSGRQAKLVSRIPDFNNNRTDGFDDFTRYGTYKYLRTDSTGYFYVKKIDGRWWMIDPNGYAGINMAVTSFTSANIQNDYDITYRLGYNGTGNFLSSESQTKSGYNLQNYHQFSYTRRLNFFLSYKNVRKNYYTTPAEIAGSLDYIFVLDPQFAVYCDNLASANVTPFAEERDLLGWFTDNEINFNQDQLQHLIRDLPAGDPSHDAALAWAETKGLTEADCATYTSAVTENIKQEFAAYLAEHYFKTVAEAIRKYDSKHLILGSRLHGRPRAIAGVVAASHKYMDVTSVNFYNKWSPNEEIAAPSWTNDKPCIVTEFYIKDINRQSGTQSGAGWYVNSQAHRGYFYQNTCIELLKNKNYIGWHYFRFKDDDDGSNKGIVDNSGSEYTDMTTCMEELNKQVYRIIEHFDGVNRRPQKGLLPKSLTATEDTYVIAGASETGNFGSAAELDVRYASQEANRREAFLKFDLSSVKDLLPCLKNAVLKINCTTSNQESRYFFASGIADVSWQEMTFTGALRQPVADWKNGYNRLAFKKGVVEQGELLFNVTNWIYYTQPENTTVSFKIHEFTATNTPFKIASREYTDASLAPTLELTFYSDGLSVAAATGDAGYKIYPNPARDVIHVDGRIKGMELFNLNGCKIKQTMDNAMEIQDVNNGMYIVCISHSADSAPYYCKLLIQK
ncbi:MAG: hypothetical protein LBR34_01325 [Prevotella sp.]|jgi:hypothetical protein|nr:hypothetical protein [Prevotella sp.]